MLRSLPLCLTLLLATSAAAQDAAPHAAPDPPDWTAEAVVYQLFPERFANGDPTNDPTWASLDFPERIDPDLWTVSDWTADWYSRQPWEVALGDDFYDDGVFQRRYGGDLQGVIDRIPYLDSLGVNVVYFNPVFWAASLHKYDATSFHHIDPHFGPDPEGDKALIATETADPDSWVWTAADRLFFEMLDAFHARGIRVLLDGVFNHTGTRFWAFADVEENQQRSAYADWYAVTAWDDPATPDTSEFDWEGWWGFKPLAVLADSPDSLDLHPEVKAHVFAATARWQDPDGDGDPSDGIDGWRLDVTEEVPRQFWRDWTAHVRAINPDAVTIAEVWDDADDYLPETGLDGTMNYHAFAIPLDGFVYDRREPASQFGRHVVDATADYGRHVPALMNLTSSHDTDRLASMIVNGSLGANYDRQAVPRHEPRYKVRAPTDAEREVQRLVVALQFAMPGMPTVYYGDEAGMWGADDPDDRKPMVWPDRVYADEVQAPRGRRSPDPVAFDHGLFDFYRRAVALRRSDPVLQRGTLRLLAAVDDAETVVFERALNGERRVIAVNRSDESQFVALPEHRGFAPMTPLFASTPPAERLAGLNVVVLDDGTTTVGVRVPPRTTVVYRPTAAADVRPNGLDE